MPVIKNEIPILEYDSDKNAVIMPDHEGLGLKLPEKAVFAFLRDCIEDFARENNARVVSEFVSMTKNYPIYVLNFDGEDICFCQAPVGAAASAQILDWLIAYGVKKIISTGCCGVLTDIPENTFLIPVKALRDEGTSYHYLPPSRYVELSKDAVRAIENVMDKKNLPCTECITWSTDGFYRETAEKVAYRKSEGCSVVEMECAALAACAQMRGAVFGQLLFTADSLANVHDYDERGWGTDSYEKALALCFDIIREM